MDKLQHDVKESENELKKIFVKQIHVNISFNILLAIILVTLLIIFSQIQCFSAALKLTFNFLLLFFLSLFLLTILLVLNRVYVIMKKDNE